MVLSSLRSGIMCSLRTPQPSTDMSVDMSVDCRCTYGPMLHRYVSRHIADVSNVSVDMSTNISVAILTDTSRSICQLSVGGHVDR